ncbi:MAG: two-component sensor histidine kinase [Hungatella sp.]|nr:two-component sensor histidine kinase [Hungatella sp.]
MGVPLATWIKGMRQKGAVSMKVPLFLLFLLVGFFPMYILGKVTDQSFRQTQLDSRVIEVQNQCLIISNKMSRVGYMNEDSRDSTVDVELDTIADIFNGRIVVINRNFKVIKDTFRLAEGRTHVAEEIIRCFQGESSNRLEREKHYFALAVPVYDNTEEKNIDGVLVATASTENLIGMAERVSEKAAFFQLMAWWVLVLVAIVLVMILMRPFGKLQNVLNRVAEGNLDQVIEEDTYKETRQISLAVQNTMTKLKTVDQSREEFVSNVSHELKTPITSIRVLADSLMGMEEVPVELYREFMTDISDEIDRESKIIDDLLSLVKMDKAVAELNVAQLDINVLVQQIMKRLRPIARKRNIELIYESIREVTADVDEVKLSLAINNLIENAIKYNVEDGWVRVTLDADHKFFYIKVADSGIGIPEEFQEHVFERFYRVDKARSRETGGTGLGLAITRKVILMHHGAVRLVSKEGEGSTFTVRIPLNYISYSLGGTV